MQNLDSYLKDISKIPTPGSSLELLYVIQLSSITLESIYDLKYVY